MFIFNTTIEAGLDLQMLLGRLRVLERVGALHCCTRCGFHVDEVL